MERQKTIDNCKAHFAEKKNVDEVITMLRASEFSKIDCIKALVDICGLTLAEAKKTVHFSPAWSDTRESDERFHSDLADLLSKLEK